MKSRKYILTGLLRLLMLRPCREPFCNERVRCWRWHVEVFTCPTCKREVDEFDPQYRAVLDAVMKPPPSDTLRPPHAFTYTAKTPPNTYVTWDTAER